MHARSAERCGRRSGGAAAAWMRSAGAAGARQENGSGSTMREQQGEQRVGRVAVWKRSAGAPHGSVAPGALLQEPAADSRRVSASLGGCPTRRSDRGEALLALLRGYGRFTQKLSKQQPVVFCCVL